MGTSFTFADFILVKDVVVFMIPLPLSREEVFNFCQAISGRSVKPCFLRWFFFLFLSAQKKVLSIVRDKEIGPFSKLSLSRLIRFVSNQNPQKIVTKAR